MKYRRGEIKQSALKASFPIFKGYHEKRKPEARGCTTLPSSPRAVKRAYNDVSRGRYSHRDLALATTVVFTGYRIGEAVQLRRQDVGSKRRVVVIRQLKRRGEFQRVVPVPSNLY